MKNCLVFLIIGLLIASAAPVMGENADVNVAPFPAFYSAQLGQGDTPVIEPSTGPARDLGDDWIQYDDNQPAFLRLTPGNYWSRTRFTPNADFRLKGLIFMPYNFRRSEADCNIYVYSEDQESGDLDELLFEAVEDRLPDFSNDMDDNWVTIEIDEDDWIDFDGGETFSIMYGPAPGGNINAPDNAIGWWNLYDADTNTRRSFTVVGNQPSANHADWGRLDGDLLIRANGDYLDSYFDLGIDNVYDTDKEDGNWIVTPGFQQSFTALVTNYGNDIEFGVISFQIYDSEGNAIWDQNADMIIENLGAEESIEVECDSTWIAGDPGYYTVEVIAMLDDDDANADNDFKMLEQIVIDPENNADMWVGYCDEVGDSRLVGDDSTGWIASWAHPGGNDLLWLTDFRVGLGGVNAEVQALCGVAVFDPVQRQYNWEWIGRIPYADQNASWLEVNLADTNYVTFAEGQEVWVCYFYTDCGIMVDGTPPISGVNPDMKPTMYQTFNLGNGAGDAGSGDYMIQAKLGFSDEAIDGAHLRIEPDTLEFGYELEQNREYSITATFTSYGTMPVTVTNLEIAPSAGDYITVDVEGEFELEAEGGTRDITITFMTPEPFELNSRIRVISNDDNNRLKIWPIHASTFINAVNDRPEMPFEYSLSQNHPNPFNPTTSVDFSLARSGQVELNVFDMSGRKVQQAFSGSMNAGNHTVEINASVLPAGIYLYRLEAGDFTSTKKMILLK